MRRYVTTTACNIWRQIACSFQAKCGNVLLIAKNIWNPAFFSNPVGESGQKGSCMLFTFFRPKALLRGTLPSRPNKGVCPPSRKHLQNKEFSVQYVYNLATRKEKKTNKHLAGKSKWQNINIKVKENKTRIRIKISEFYKWYSSNTVDIRSARRLFRRYFGLFIFSWLK